MSDPILQLKEPPHSREAEQSLLGALLLDNTAFEDVAFLTAEHFYADGHRRIWRAIARMIEAGKVTDVVTLCDDLGEDLQKAGGPAYLAALAQNTPSAFNIKRYAEVVYEKSVRRQLAHAATEIADQALTPSSADVRQLLDESEGRILRIAEGTARHGDGPVELSTLLSQVFERIDHLHSQENPSGITGVPTGFTDLDHRTAGMQPGDLIIVAGRPSMGKTAFALNVAEHVSLAHKLPSLIFSMEMSGQQLAQRLMGSLAHLDQHKLRTGRLTNEEWPLLTDAIEKLHGAPIEIDESGGLNALEMRARARRVKRQSGKLGLIVVDYLQLMEAKDRGENRATDIAEITRSLKAMAKELNVPVLALSQLSRKVEDRTDKRPHMSDLRESGAIEQDADVILFIYREEVYSPEVEELKGVAEVIIGKQRNGPIGTVPLTFLGQHTRFGNYQSTSNGGAWYPPRPKRGGKVKNFNDYKSAAAGEPQG